MLPANNRHQQQQQQRQRQLQQQQQQQQLVQQCVGNSVDIVLAKIVLIVALPQKGLASSPLYILFPSSSTQKVLLCLVATRYWRAATPVGYLRCNGA